MVHHAWNAGLETIDPAVAYGDSEQRLGDADVEGWKVVTKLPPLPKGLVEALRELFHNSRVNTATTEHY